jgi:hypothetical protein
MYKVEEEPVKKNPAARRGGGALHSFGRQPGKRVCLAGRARYVPIPNREDILFLWTKPSISS